LRIHHEDGRAFVRQASRRNHGPYDVVYVDAVDDFAVPYQLTTHEFFAEVRALLAPEGMLLVNTIDALDSGLLLGALAATAREVFDDVTVWAPADAGRLAVASRTTFVVAANASGVGTESNDRGIARMSDDALERTIRRTGSTVLSDDHAPVEHLVAPVVRAAAREMGANQALRRALAAAAAGDADGYLESCRLSVSLDPSLAEAHYNLGLAWYSRKERGKATDHWRRALALHPGYFEAHFSLATALLHKGDAESARRHFAAARELRPRSGPAARGLGIALEALGDLGAALTHYREAVTLSPKDGDSADAVRRLEAGAASIDPLSRGT
jgi:tetratricopeptide (TPR) repeat protein